MTKSPTRKSKSGERRVVGLRHIAEDLNVSISLVSKVLSGRLGNSGANKDLIEAIHKRAGELDYRKNHLAAALRTGRQNVIGVLVRRHGSVGSTIVDDMVGGIAAAAMRNGQRLMLQFYESTEQFGDLSRGLRKNVVDGVIMGGLPYPELMPHLVKIHASGVPVVTIHDRQMNSEFTNIGLDQVDVIRAATLHLIDDCHCRRLAHLWIRGEATDLSAVRYQGFLAALKERNLPLIPELVVEVPGFGYDSGLNAGKFLIERGVPFDGIVGQSDEHAVGALNALFLAGKKVPQDVKITGVDNAPICTCSIVPVTSVSQEFRTRGEMAISLLLKALTGTASPSVNFKPVVHIRGSTDPSAKNTYVRS